MAVAVAAAIVTIAAGAQPAQAAPRGFFGVVASSVPQPSEFQQMARGGAGGVRFLIYWRQVQSVDAAHYDWSQVDPIVAGAAQAGLPLLPFIYGTPAWAADCRGIPNGFCDRADPLRTAAGRAGWRSFVAAAVDRYGPNGTFWSDTSDGFNPPKLPIREWQIWNEPNSTTFWRPRPSPKRYGKLLRVSAAAIHSRDRRARIDLAGLFGTPPKPSQSLWKFLDGLYRLKGIRSKFNAVAVHPYSGNVKGIRYQLRRTRRLMADHNDKKTPIVLTELGWGSGSPTAPPPQGGPLQKGEQGQAQMLASSFRLLAKSRRTFRISRVYWFTWQDLPLATAGECFLCASAGLFTADGAAKPAWSAFARSAGGQP
jgi:polysaccharide biosynthesis protein PslG